MLLKSLHTSMLSHLKLIFYAYIYTKAMDIFCLNYNLSKKILFQKLKKKLSIYVVCRPLQKELPCVYLISFHSLEQLCLSLTGLPRVIEIYQTTSLLLYYPNIFQKNKKNFQAIRFKHTLLLSAKVE